MGKSIEGLETPALLLEQNILEANLTRMQKLAEDNEVALRPHIKTHKSPVLAKRQIQKGATGIAVATLQEAEAMIEAGITDIQLANEIAGQPQIAHFLALRTKADISCAVGHPEQVRAINARASEQNLIVPVFIEINTGLNRAGIATEADAVKLGQMVEEQSGMHLRGVMTHAGHAYGAGSRQEIEEIGKTEGQKLVSVAEAMRQAGLKVPVVSVGSTPTAPYSMAVKGVTELRVGNYIVNDGIQVALGVAGEDACALSVLTTVISLPSSDRVITDSGTKSLTSDQGAHGNTGIRGFGKVLGKAGHLTRFSEEHGVIENVDSSQFEMGEKLRILPNHACPVFNLFSKVLFVNGTEIVQEIAILGKR